MTVKQIADQKGVSVRTISRRIAAYNKLHNKTFLNGTNHTVVDPELLEFINNGKKSPVNGSSVLELTDKENESKKTRIRKKPCTGQKTSLQYKLSSDWLVIVVISVMLIADATAFYIITDNSIGNISKLFAPAFAVLGFFTGLGGVITYARIKNKTTAEVWKWIFAFFQAAAFLSAINFWWSFGKVVITVMMSSVFAGVITSVKDFSK